MPFPLLLPVSGNEITDAVRALGLQGDGRLNDGSFGIYEQRANQLTNGGYELPLTTGWGSSALAPNPSQDTTQSKFGTTSCRIDASGYRYLAQGLTLGVGMWTISVWCKAENHVTATGSGGGLIPEIGTAVVTFPDGQFAGLASSRGTTGWVRLSLRVNVTTAGTVTIVVTGNYGGTGSGYLNFDGAMLNAGPVALPYCEGTTPVCRVQAPASLLNATQGGIVLRARPNWPGGSPPFGGSGTVLASWLDDANNRILVYVDGGGSLSCYRIGGGVGGGQAQTSFGGVAASTPATVIAKWTATTLSVSLNGAAFVTVAQSTVPALAASTFDIGSQGTGNQFDGEAMWAATFAGTLTDANAATIHAFGNAGPVYLDLLPGNPTMLWDADTPRALASREFPVGLFISDAAAGSLTLSDTAAGTLGLTDDALGRLAISDRAAELTP